MARQRRTYKWKKPIGWDRTRAYILARDKGACWICGKDGARSVDHVLPRAMGGGEGEDNLRAAHLYCNLMRTRHMKRSNSRRRVALPQARTPRW